MGIIKAFKLGFDYLRYDEDGNVEDMQRAVNDVNLDIEAGEFVAVLGHNGSGKSTLAKHMNALVDPDRGNHAGGRDRHCQRAGTLESTAESGNGISESGQPDHRNGGRRRCGIWTGKHGNAYRRYLETCG